MLRSPGVAGMTRLRGSARFAGCTAFAAIMLLLAGCGCLRQRTGDTAHYRLVGYVAGAQSFPHIDASWPTALNYAFAHIDARGRIVLDQPGAEAFLARLRALRSAEPKLHILVSIGGWGADGFSDAASSTASRERFADSAAELIVHEDVDGIDLDWEYPTRPGAGIRHRPEDRHDFTLLLAVLRRRLDALADERHRHPDNPYLLTAALADGRFASGIELDRVHVYLDWINLMTYDFHNSLTPTTGHQSALSPSLTAGLGERSVAAAVRQYLDAGVPARKLVVGVPLYARAFGDVRAFNHGLDQPYGHYVGDYPWSKLVTDFIGRNGFVRYWDAVAEVPYLWNARTREFISYDDPRSLAVKAAFVRSHRLGGMMYWEQSQDPRGRLIRVLAQGLGRAPPAPEQPAEPARSAASPASHR